MNILDIANGHIKEVLNLNEELSKNRLEICYKCPLFSKRLGGICSSKLWLNVNTGDVSSTAKEGYIRGCNCRMLAKTRIPNARCVAGKW
jgi:hypothetical protein